MRFDKRLLVQTSLFIIAADFICQFFIAWEDGVFFCMEQMELNKYQQRKTFVTYCLQRRWSFSIKHLTYMVGVVDA